MHYLQRLRLPLLVAGLLAALYLLLIQERIALPNRAAMALWNLAHLPLFFLLTVLFDLAMLSRHSHRLGVWLQLLLPPLLIFAFGTEWLQSLTDRQPSWLDVLTNCTGIALATLWLAMRRYASRRGQKFAQLFFVAVAIAVLYRPAELAYADYHSAVQFPILSDFESAADGENWSYGERSTDMARDGKQSLRVSLPNKRFAGTTLRHFPSDWSTYEQLRLSVYNSGSAPLPLSLRIHDRQHEVTQQGYHDRFNYNFSAAPGWTDIVLPLARIESGPRERRLDLHHIIAMRVFYQGTPAAGVSFYVDAVYLAGEADNSQQAEQMDRADSAAQTALAEPSDSAGPSSQPAETEPVLEPAEHSDP